MTFCTRKRPDNSMQRKALRAGAERALANRFFVCGPTGADPLNNRAYPFPGAGAIYWVAVHVRPKGSTEEIEVVYPYCRFMSLISYAKGGLA
jgi:hypothetical protein